MTIRRKAVVVVVAVVMFGLLLLSMFGDNGVLELWRMHSDSARLKSANARLVRENLKMYRTVERLQNDSAFLEDVARRELGMIRSDEVIFKFKKENSKTVP